MRLALAAIAALCLLGAPPAAASTTLAQKPGAAGCIGTMAPCAIGPGIGNARAVAVSPDGRSVYALSGYGGVLVVFDRAAGGTLRQKAGPGGCLASPGASNPDAASCAGARAIVAPTGVTVSPDGRSVYVSSAGHAVAVFDRAADGTLTQKPGLPGCIAEDTASTGIGPCTAGVGLRVADAVAVSPDGANVYIAGEEGSIAVFDRAPDGTLTQKPGLAACLAQPARAACAVGRALFGLGDLVVSADGRNVYGAGSWGVVVFDRAGDGTLTQKAGSAACFSDVRFSHAAGCTYGKALKVPTGVAISPDGASVYVSSATSAAIAVFDRQPGGALLPKPGVAACVSGKAGGGCAAGRGLADAVSVTVGPDGASVYVASPGLDAPDGFPGAGFVAIFDRAAGGALTQPAGAAACVSDDGAKGACIDGTQIGSPYAVVASPDGRNVYVAADNRGAIGVFDRVAAPPDAISPALRGLAPAPKRLRALTRGASVVARGGTKISYNLSEPATVRFTVQRVVAGRRVGGRCVTARRSNRAARRCDRYRDVAGSFSQAGTTGRNSLRFSGRLRGRRLARGHYRLRAVARDAAGNRSRAQVARFAIR